MPSIPGHVHISERESDGSWEDCTWDAGLEWYRLTYDLSKPATHAEAQALRAASGEPPTGGSNVGDLRRGIRVRYGVLVPAAVSGFVALRAALKPGYAAMAQGSMSAFGPTHRLSRWQTGFDAGHAVLIANIDGVLLWCDPLAPPSAAVPVTVTWQEVAAYVNSFGGEHLVAPIQSLVQEDSMALSFLTYTPGAKATIKAASNVRVEPLIASAKVRTTAATETVTLLGTVKGDVDPANGSNIWYAFIEGLAVHFTAKDNVTSVAPAPTTGFTQAQLDAAVAAQKQADAVAQATAVANAVAAEKARVRGVLGV